MAIPTSKQQNGLQEEYIEEITQNHSKMKSKKIDDMTTEELDKAIYDLGIES